MSLGMGRYHQDLKIAAPYCIGSNLAAGGVIAGNLAIEELATQQLETIYSWP
jgi:hypothetical protein